MKKLVTIAFATVLFAGVSQLAHAQIDPACDTDASGDLSCEEARCCFQQRILDECQCTAPAGENPNEKPNHGRFVSCAAHLIKDLVEAGMPRNCKGKLQRCAARSVCGKQDKGFHTCTTVTYGSCVTGDTVSGALVCDTDFTTPCTTNTDCIASSRCKTTRHPEDCEANGGQLDLSPTCCSSCTAPAPTP